MSQFDYIKEIAKYGLENNQDKLWSSLNELVDYSKKSKKINFAIQLQSILKNSVRHNNLSKVNTIEHFRTVNDPDVGDLILEKINSDYRLKNIIAENEIIDELKFFIEEHEKSDILKWFDLPLANKLLMHGPSGCGKTLASYVLAGELNKTMIVVNLGSIVSSKLGETSKNLTKIFRKASLEDCIIFIDEFDSIGKIRDYDQDHGEMKRVVNTILQLFDYLPQGSILISATNQKEMIDSALLRRFDNSIEFKLPTDKGLKKLVNMILDNGQFSFDNKDVANKIIKESVGLSYYTVQKTLIIAIKRSLFSTNNPKNKISRVINTKIWRNLIKIEKKFIN